MFLIDWTFLFFEAYRLLGFCMRAFFSFWRCSLALVLLLVLLQIILPGCGYLIVEKPEPLSSEKYDKQEKVYSDGEGSRSDILPPEPVPEKEPVQADPEPAEEIFVDLVPEVPSAPDASVEKTRDTEATHIEKNQPDTRDAPSCKIAGDYVLGSEVCCPQLKKIKIEKGGPCTGLKEGFLCLACGDGRCDALSGESFCSCPQDCKKGMACKKDADCPPGTCKQMGNHCVHNSERCKDGFCTAQSQQINQANCDAKTGFCIPKKTCKVDADCGNPSCSDQKDYCVRIRPYCQSNLCRRSITSTFNYTCSPKKASCEPTRCKSAKDCLKPSCQKSSSDCIQISSNCSLGVCQTVKKLFKKAICHTNGLCQSQVCQKASDCGKPTCVQQGAHCLQKALSCQQGRCLSSNKTISYATCHAKTGLCSVRSCKKDSDCGSSSCSRNADFCVQTTPSCRSGVCGGSTTKNILYASCQKNGQCKLQFCKKDSDCASPSCKTQGSNCEQTEVRCSAGICLTRSRVMVNMRCHSGSNLCGRTCSTSANCDKMACQQQGTSCHQFSSRCDQSVCVNKQSLLKVSVCDLVSGQCRASRLCLSTRTCGAISCKQDGDFCVQQIPSCRVGLCHYTKRAIRYSNCIKSTASCKSKSCKKSSDCGTSTCQQKGVSCIQTQPMCAKGVCQSQEITYPKGKCLTSGLCQRIP